MTSSFLLRCSKFQSPSRRARSQLLLSLFWARVLIRMPLLKALPTRWTWPKSASKFLLVVDKVQKPRTRSMISCKWEDGFYSWTAIFQQVGCLVLRQLSKISTIRSTEISDCGSLQCPTRVSLSLFSRIRSRWHWNPPQVSNRTAWVPTMRSRMTISRVVSNQKSSKSFSGPSSSSMLLCKTGASLVL